MDLWQSMNLLNCTRACWGMKAIQVLILPEGLTFPLPLPSPLTPTLPPLSPSSLTSYSTRCPPRPSPNPTYPVSPLVLTDTRDVPVHLHTHMCLKSTQHPPAPQGHPNTHLR